jgi:hypothetical protein
MSTAPDVAATGEALLDALGLTGDTPVSAWPDFPDPDGCDDDEHGEWIVGVAKRDWGGPHYAVTAEDIEIGDTPGMYEEIAKVGGRKRAEALAAHLNAMLGRAP